jgi:lysophospholipase L1-like esterase
MHASGLVVKPFRHRFSLATFAVIVAVGFSELAARIFFPTPPDRTRQPPLAYLYDPEIEYVLAPRLKGWIDGGLVTVNALGFRGAEVASPKPQGRLRIVIVGDSVTFGLGMADDESFPAQLEHLLHERFPNRDLDVVNLGVPGYDTRQEVTLLKRNLARLDPDVVLVGFYTNDVPDVIADKSTSASAGPRTGASDPRIGQIFHVDPTSPSWVDRYSRDSRLIYLVARAINRWRGVDQSATPRFALEIDMLQGKDSAPLQRAWATIAAQFGDLRSIADSRHLVAGIIALPCRELVTGQYPSRNYLNRIRALAEPLGLFVIDPIPVMTAHAATAEDLFIPYDRDHPSRTGDRLIAQAIVSYLEQHVTALLASKESRKS